MICQSNGVILEILYFFQENFLTAEQKRLQQQLQKHQKILQEDRKDSERLLCDYEGEIASLKLNIKLAKKKLEEAEKERQKNKGKIAKKEGLKKKLEEGNYFVYKENF